MPSPPLFSRLREANANHLRTTPHPTTISHFDDASRAKDARLGPLILSRQLSGREDKQRFQDRMVSILHLFWSFTVVGLRTYGRRMHSRPVIKRCGFLLSSSDKREPAAPSVKLESRSNQSGALFFVMTSCCNQTNPRDILLGLAST
jgi:hypothetical protein